MTQIMLIDDDEIMAECITRAIKLPDCTITYFSNAIVAMNSLNEQIPDLIILDILLDGPDGFSFLNELSSYDDTAKIPIIIITSLNLQSSNLKHYGVHRILQKESMTPTMINTSVNEVLAYAA